ncbi:MAG: hypothetical protein WCG80_18020 [Spirochaetales bacterium]
MILYFQKLSLKTRFIGVLVSFFLVFCAYYAFSSTPWLLVQLKQYSPEHGMPDQLWWYTPAELHTILGAWGVVGRDFYRTVLFPCDAVFPLLYNGFLLLTQLYLFKKINPRSGWWYLLCMLPLLGCVADLGENLGVLTSSLLYPDRWDTLGWITGGMTTAKWTLLVANLCIIGALLVWHWAQRIRLLLSPDR